MNTYLGISAELGPKDANLEVASNAEIVFLEGYLFDKDKGKEAFIKLAKECRAAGGLSGIAISDPFCVERHKAARYWIRIKGLHICEITNCVQTTEFLEAIDHIFSYLSGVKSISATSCNFF